VGENGAVEKAAREHGAGRVGALEILAAQVEAF